MSSWTKSELLEEKVIELRDSGRVRGRIERTRERKRAKIYRRC